MRRRAFTLLEVLVCIAIVAILAGLLFPVYKGAKRDAQIASTTVRFRQIHAAIELYRQDYGGSGAYGDLATMNLPSGLQLGRMMMNQREFAGVFPANIFWSACGQHPKATRLFGGSGPLVWMPVDNDLVWIQPVIEYGDRMIMVYDVNCNDGNVLINSNHESKFALGLLLGGTVLRARKPGNVERPEFWSGTP